MTGQTILFSLTALGLGALWCFAGYRFFIVLLAVGGFLVGFALGSTLAPGLVGSGGDPQVVGWIAGGIVGLAVAALARYLFHLGVSLLAGALAAWAVTAVAANVGVEAALIPIVAVVGGIVGAILAAVIQAPKWLVVGLTSLSGAAVMVAGGLVLVGRVEPAAFWSAAQGLRLGPESILFGLDTLRARVMSAFMAPVDVLGAEPAGQVAIIALTVLGVSVQARGLGLLPVRRLVPRSA